MDSFDMDQWMENVLDPVNQSAPEPALQSVAAQVQDQVQTDMHPFALSTGMDVDKWLEGVLAYPSEDEMRADVQFALEFESLLATTDRDDREQDLQPHPVNQYLQGMIRQLEMASTQRIAIPPTNTGTDGLMPHGLGFAGTSATEAANSSIAAHEEHRGRVQSLLAVAPITIDDDADDDVLLIRQIPVKTPRDNRDSLAAAPQHSRRHGNDKRSRGHGHGHDNTNKVTKPHQGPLRERHRRRVLGDLSVAKLVRLLAALNLSERDREEICDEAGITDEDVADFWDRAEGWAHMMAGLPPEMANMGR